jgi:hypothetical protein
LENAGSAGLADDIKARSDFRGEERLFRKRYGQQWLTLRATAFAP